MSETNEVERVVMCEIEDGGTLASEVIADLQVAIDKHGDLPVYIMADDYGWYGGVSHEPTCRPRVKTFPNSTRKPERLVIIDT